MLIPRQKENKELKATAIRETQLDRDEVADGGGVVQETLAGGSLQLQAIAPKADAGGAQAQNSQGGRGGAGGSPTWGMFSEGDEVGSEDVGLGLAECRGRPVRNPAAFCQSG